MSRPRVSESKVTLMPVTQQLLDQLDPLDLERRRALFEKAGVPVSNYHNWRHGLWHPSAHALHQLAQAMGQRLVLVDATPEKD